MKNVRGNKAKTQSKIIPRLRKASAVRLCATPSFQQISKNKRDNVDNEYSESQANFCNPSHFVKREALQKKTLLWEMLWCSLEGRDCIFASALKVHYAVCYLRRFTDPYWFGFGITRSQMVNCANWINLIHKPIVDPQSNKSKLMWKVFGWWCDIMPATTRGTLHSF